MNNISIIIPTYNEAAGISALIKYLLENNAGSVLEIIVVDGGSTDATQILAEIAGAKVLKSSQKGRAAQMNYGAKNASGEILYFLHADSYPPKSFSNDIIQQVNQGIESGCYRLAFDFDHWFLKLNCWFTRFNVNAVRFGDQSLYVKKDKFIKAGKFDESLVIMEDQEIIPRIRKHTRFKVFNNYVITSARKYNENGIYKMQGIFFMIYFMYQLGYSQESLKKFLNAKINSSKLS